MKRLFKYSGILFLSPLAIAAISGAPETEDEFITPADPVHSLRSTMVPCYDNYRGIGRNLEGQTVQGEECPEHLRTLPKRADRPEPDVEMDSSNPQFLKRME